MNNLMRRHFMGGKKLKLNDKYALNFINENQIEGDLNHLDYGNLSNFDFKSNWTFEITFHPFSLANLADVDINILLGVILSASGSNIRLFAAINGSTTTVEFGIRPNSSSSVKVTSTNDLLLNTDNNIIIGFNTTSGISLEVNGNLYTNSTVPDISNLTLNGTYNTGNTVGNISSSITHRNIDGYAKNIIFKNGSTTKYEYKLNQESATEVFENVSQNFQDILRNFTTLELSSGGGAWVDTTTL